jgi:hypothetical protein
LVTLLDLAVHTDGLDTDVSEDVTIESDQEAVLRVVLPHLVFDQHIDLGGRR